MKINHVLGYDIYKFKLRNGKTIFSAKKDGSIICRSTSINGIVNQLMHIMGLSL